MLSNDTLHQQDRATNGTVQVDGGSELDLNASTIDQGIVTVHGALKATVGDQHAVQSRQRHWHQHVYQ